MQTPPLNKTNNLSLSLYIYIDIFGYICIIYIYISSVRPSRRVRPVAVVVLCPSVLPSFLLSFLLSVRPSRRPSRRRRLSSVRRPRRVRPSSPSLPSVRVPSSVLSSSSVLCPSVPSRRRRPSSIRPSVHPNYYSHGVA